MHFDSKLVASLTCSIYLLSATIGAAQEAQDLLNGRPANSKTQTSSGSQTQNTLPATKPPTTDDSGELDLGLTSSQAPAGMPVFERLWKETPPASASIKEKRPAACGSNSISFQSFLDRSKKIGTEAKNLQDALVKMNQRIRGNSAGGKNISDQEVKKFIASASSRILAITSETNFLLNVNKEKYDSAQSATVQLMWYQLIANYFSIIERQFVVLSQNGQSPNISDYALNEALDISLCRAEQLSGTTPEESRVNLVVDGVDFRQNYLSSISPDEKNYVLDIGSVNDAKSNQSSVKLRVGLEKLKSTKLQQIDLKESSSSSLLNVYRYYTANLIYGDYLLLNQYRVRPQDPGLILKDKPKVLGEVAGLSATLKVFRNQAEQAPESKFREALVKAIPLMAIKPEDAAVVIGAPNKLPEELKKKLDQEVQAQHKAGILILHDSQLNAIWDQFKFFADGYPAGTGFQATEEKTKKAYWVKAEDYPNFCYSHFNLKNYRLQRQRAEVVSSYFSLIARIQKDVRKYSAMNEADLKNYLSEMVVQSKMNVATEIGYLIPVDKDIFPKSGVDAALANRYMLKIESEFKKSKALAYFVSSWIAKAKLESLPSQQSTERETFLTDLRKNSKRFVELTAKNKPVQMVMDGDQEPEAQVLDTAGKVIMSGSKLNSDALFLLNTIRGAGTFASASQKSKEIRTIQGNRLAEAKENVKALRGTANEVRAANNLKLWNETNSQALSVLKHFALMDKSGNWIDYSKRKTPNLRDLPLTEEMKKDLKESVQDTFMNNSIYAIEVRGKKLYQLLATAKNNQEISDDVEKAIGIMATNMNTWLGKVDKAQSLDDLLILARSSTLSYLATHTYQHLGKYQEELLYQFTKPVVRGVSQKIVAGMQGPSEWAFGLALAGLPFRLLGWAPGMGWVGRFGEAIEMRVAEMGVTSVLKYILPTMIFQISDTFGEIGKQSAREQELKSLYETAVQNGLITAEDYRIVKEGVAGAKQGLWFGLAQNAAFMLSPYFINGLRTVRVTAERGAIERNLKIIESELPKEGHEVLAAWRQKTAELSQRGFPRKFEDYHNNWGFNRLIEEVDNRGLLTAKGKKSVEALQSISYRAQKAASHIAAYTAKYDRDLGYKPGKGPLDMDELVLDAHNHNTWYSLVEELYKTGRMSKSEFVQAQTIHIKFMRALSLKFRNLQRLGIPQGYDSTFVNIETLYAKMTSNGAQSPIESPSTYLARDHWMALGLKRGASISEVNQAMRQIRISTGFFGNRAMKSTVKELNLGKIPEEGMLIDGDGRLMLAFKDHVYDLTKTSLDRDFVLRMQSEGKLFEIKKMIEVAREVLSDKTRRPTYEKTLQEFETAMASQGSSSGARPKFIFKKPEVKPDEGDQN